MTGAETIYADMRQGALPLVHYVATENPFYFLATEWAGLPLLLIVTSATIIASQKAILVAETHLITATPCHQEPCPLLATYDGLSKDRLGAHCGSPTELDQTASIVRNQKFNSKRRRAYRLPNNRVLP